MPKFRERRVAVRPREGDAQSCPFCRSGLLRFQSPESHDAEPCWVCDSPTCGYRTSARRPTAREHHRALVERAAKARRKSMAVRARADRLLKRSELLAERQRRKK